MSARSDRFLRLTRDVVNPRADRRKKYDWTALPVLLKGARFRLETETEMITLAGSAITSTIERIYQEPGPSHRWVNEDHPLFKLILDAALEDATDTLDRVKRDTGLGEVELLQALLDQRRITLAELRAAAKRKDAQS